MLRKHSVLCDVILQEGSCVVGSSLLWSFKLETKPEINISIRCCSGFGITAPVVEDCWVFSWEEAWLWAGFYFLF